MEPLAIKSSRGTYTVAFADDLREVVADLCALEDVLVVVDEQVARLYALKLEALIGSRPTVRVSASEENKTLTGCELIIGALVGQGATRSTRIVAIGGGIIQDLVTLAAHIYHRGISWIYVPTTLLSMADSCIGAKASINFGGFKNQLGVFHSPEAVHVCPEFLSTLPQDEVRSGYGEVFKLHFASSPKSFFFLAETVERDGWINRSLAATIRACLEIKKRYIEADEFDNGVRRHLNYGHTFGHALESISGHSIPHGLAVCWGMDLINFLSLQAKGIDEKLFSDAHGVFERLFSWQLKQPIDISELLTATRKDKKSSGGRLTLIVPGPEGTLAVVRREYTKELSEQLREYLSTFSIVTYQQSSVQ